MAAHATSVGTTLDGMRMIWRIVRSWLVYGITSQHAMINAGTAMQTSQAYLAGGR